jgi:hypothetical protein
MIGTCRAGLSASRTVGLFAMLTGNGVFVTVTGAAFCASLGVTMNALTAASVATMQVHLFNVVACLITFPFFMKSVGLSDGVGAYTTDWKLTGTPKSFRRRRLTPPPIGRILPQRWDA